MNVKEYIQAMKDEADYHKYRDSKYSEQLSFYATAMENKQRELRSIRWVAERLEKEERNSRINKLVSAYFSSPRTLKGPPIDE